MTTFHQDHRQLREIMRRFAAHMAAGTGECVFAMLVRERLAFARLFQPHVRAEEQAVAAAAGHGLPAPVATEHRRRMQAIRVDYSLHVNRWTPDDIRRDWSGYCTEVTKLQQRLYDQMDWEERKILPLLPTVSTIAA